MFIIIIGILYVFSIKYINMIWYIVCECFYIVKIKIISKLLFVLLLYKYIGVNKEYDIELMLDFIYFCYKL